jgi:hypothetical protein
LAHSFGILIWELPEASSSLLHDYWGHCLTRDRHFINIAPLRLGEEFLLVQGLTLSNRLFRRGRDGEFLEARIIPERIEHRIEPE